MKYVVIIGAGDLGREAVWLIEDINRLHPTYVILGFLDDDSEKAGREVSGYKVLGGVRQLERLAAQTPLSAVLAIQDGTTRKRIVEAHPDFAQWETIAHPTAVIAPTSRIGRGSLVFPQAAVSVNTTVGGFNLLYIHAIICNDCSLGNYVSVMSGASVSERVEIGDESFLAAGSCVYPHQRIGRRVRVGVEAVVSRPYGDDAEVSERGSGFSLFK